MESITLQTNDSIVGSGELLGQLQFAASSESDGGSATFVVAKVYAQGEGAFSASSNPASIIFATSASDSLPATGRIKVDDNGNLLPLENYQYSIGRSGLAFNNLYANSGYFSSLQVNGVNVSVSGHTHTSSQITDFDESVDDRVNSLLVQGTGVKITYNDSGNTLRLDNLHSEVNVLSKEPQGFVNRLDSSLSFNDSTRTFTIQPTGYSYDMYIEGVKVTKTGVESVVIDTGTALNYIHFDIETQQLQAKISEFDFTTDVPVAFIHWNKDIGQSTFFGEERHGIRMDGSTHRWIHNTFGIQYIDGLSVSNYTLLGDGSSNSHAQIAISDGTLYQEDIIISIADGDNGVEFTQQLFPTGYFPVYYHSGITGQWIRDSGTPYPVKYNATRAFYNVYTTGIWTVENVTNNRYFAMWLVATNDINDPILAIMGQREDSSLGSSESNNNWSDIDLTNIPTNEIRPLYRLIFSTNDTYANTPKSSLQSILDLRSTNLTVTYGVPQNDHGNLFGLADDDHAQYVHINNSRTISANHTFTNGLTISSGLLSATSGNFTSLTVNAIAVPTGVGTSGYVARWISNNGLNSGILYDDATNVGIGTTAPSGKIDVRGNSYFGSPSTANSLYLRTGQSGISETALRLRTDTSSNLYLDAGNASVKVGNQSADVIISAGNGPVTIGNSATQTIANQYVRFTPANIERMRIDGTGNVGIGTTTPGGKLHVVGTGLFASTTGLSPNGLLSVYSTSSGATLFSVEGTNGNLFSVVDSTSGSLMSVNDITGLGAFEVFSDHSIVAGRYNQNDFVLSSGGNLGLGIALPSGKLHVVGNAIVSGNLGVGTTSPSYKLDVVGTGNFSQNLLVNGTGVSLSGHTHTSSQITDFNSSVSGLLPVIANSGDNRILTSTGSSVGINAESNLTFDGTTLGVTGVISIDQLRLDNNTLITTSGDLVIAPAANYALVASTGGDPRGTFAVDLQNSRIASTQVAAGTYSVIGGGGRNTALRPYSTVCGGLNNLVSGDNSVINGGLSNTIRSTYANINGGSTHTIEVNCSYSNIGGGQNSSIKLAPNSVIAGGYLHSMSGLDNDGTYGFSTIAGGFNNSLIGSYGNFIGAGAFCNITATDGTTNAVRGAAICAGQSNNIAATYSMIGAGTDNTITVSGKYSFIGAGYANTTNSNYSSIVGGNSAKTKLYGESSHAAGAFASAGDAQHTTLVARLATSDGSANQVLFLDGASERLVLSEKTTWTFTIKLSAYNDTDSAAAGWIFRGAIRRDGANSTAIVGSIIEENWKETAMDSTVASVVADDTNEALEIRVTGLAGKNIRWVATVDISQVSYGTP